MAAFEFALALSFFSAIGHQISRLFGQSQRYLRALAPLAAFPIAYLSSQLIRQSIFELRTSGALSSQTDSCTLALWPIAVVIVSLILTILAEGYAALGTLQVARRPPERLSNKTILSRSILLAMLVSTSLGAWFGWTNWIDWRINQPCL